MEEYITPKYKTISNGEKRKLLELMQSSLLNAFSYADYYDVISVFSRVINRLEDENEKQIP